MTNVHGAILTENGFKDGYVEILDKSVIMHIHNQSSPHPSQLIIPSFLNAHTHIGDTFIRTKNIPLPTDIEQLVAPPHGLKHRLLQTTDQQEIITGMVKGLQELRQHGISTFIDFRENGVDGLAMIKKALSTTPLDSIILGRPQNFEVTGKEIDDILRNSDGIGLSSVSDWDPDLLTMISKRAKQQHKIFAIHASERIQEPIDQIVDLRPDFIVHMTVASKKDLLKVKQHNIPIVVCPRSNQFFGMRPNIKVMHEIGNTIVLGTDNFMLHRPNIIDEIRYIQQTFPHLFTREQLFLMNTYQGRTIISTLKKKSTISFPTSWLILDAMTYEIKRYLNHAELA
jgi:cytosine/adenosine deaminase-related metal-dependent hydrolase